MKIRINKGTETFKKLKEVERKMIECNQAASALANELGAVNGERITAGNGIAGGLSGVKLSAKPEGWRDASKHYYGFYFPKINKKNRPILDKISALPTVKYEDLNSIIGFEFQSTGLTWFNCPGVKWGEDYILLAVSEECYFTPNEDMIEILDSEYKSLKNELDK